MNIRDVRDDDSAGILALLEAVYGEYDNCILVLDEVPDLIRPATSFAAIKGRFWVVEDDGMVCGMTACAPSKEIAGLVELKKLYVARALRGTGMGRKLIALVEAQARQWGATRVHLWTDTRFVTAHAVYERCGYVRQPETRDLHDVSASVEFHYAKDLDGA